MTMVSKLKPFAEKIFAPSALSNLANFLDNRFTLPGTKIRIGWDFFIGLIPVVGDLVAALLSSYIVIAAVYHGAHPFTVVRMLVNMVLDFMIGLIPIIGDMFDAGWMANAKNVRLLLQDLEKQGVTRDQAVA